MSEIVKTDLRAAGLDANAKRNRVKTVFSPENIQRVQETMLKSPQESTRRLSSQLKHQANVKPEHVEAVAHGSVENEAWLHLTGYANSLNFCYWSTNDPKEHFEVPLRDVKIDVWCAGSQILFYVEDFT
ncbi:hypothetical protein Trydic_g20722 [Trypoxylus dichotomus]